MTRLQTELAHMLKYLSESRTSFRAWRQYFENKAVSLATEEPKEYERLPELLAVEISRLRERAKATSTTGVA